MIVALCMVLYLYPLNASQKNSLKSPCLTTHGVPPPPQTPTHASIEGKPFVLSLMHDQLGNQLFEVAATVSLALDHGAEAVFPDLVEPSHINSDGNFLDNYQYVLWRLNVTRPEREVEYIYGNIKPQYDPIPYKDNMALLGYFQSEKYFIHHREEIINLFSPHESLVDYLYSKHLWLKIVPNTVAVHVRAYWPFFSDGKDVLPFLGFEYFEKAILTFPKDHLFVVFSNNLEWCKQKFSRIPRKFIFIEGQQPFLDLFLMGLCKHNIISNSSYSWWGAYLNRNPSKIIIAPKTWFTIESGCDSTDIVPSDWIIQD